MKRKKRINKKRRKGSSIVDYVLLIFAVVCVLIIMGVYVQRAIMGKWKESADSLGHGRQYEGEISFINYSVHF